MTAAASRAKVDQWCTTAGWDITKAMWDRPRGITRIPNIVTIHGIVRQRFWLPMKPMRNSKL